MLDFNDHVCILGSVGSQHARLLQGICRHCGSSGVFCHGRLCVNSHASRDSWFWPFLLRHPRNCPLLNAVARNSAANTVKLPGNGSALEAPFGPPPSTGRRSIGTPPLLFPVATDSRSGDLDVGGKGCVGCTTVAPNRPHNHTQSSTSKPAAPFAFSNSYQTCDLQDPTVRTYALHAPILPSKVVGRLNHLTQFSLFALIWCCRKRSQPASFRCLLSHV